MFKSGITSILIIALSWSAGPGLVVHATEASAVITSISAPAAPGGIVYSGQKAAIYGSGLSGQLTIKIGNQDAQILQIIGTSDTYAEFTVPARFQAIATVISVINSSGIASNAYSILIEVPTAPAPIISSISSKAAPEGVIYSDEQATLYGSGLSGLLSIKLGAQEPKIVQATGNGNSVSFIVPHYSQTSYVTVSVTNTDGSTSASYQAKVEVPSKPKPTPVIASVQSAGNPSGTIDAGNKASIYGSGLSGSLTIKLGNTEPKYIRITGSSDTYAEFIVPSYQQSVSVSVTVTNAENLTSNTYSLRIEVPESSEPVPVPTPVIRNIQSAANPEGVVDAGRKAAIYGSGLSGSLTIYIGTERPQIVHVTGRSDTYVEFMVPSRTQPVSTVVAVQNASGVKSEAHRITIQVEGWGSVETDSVEELLQKGGKYEASELTEKAGALTVTPGMIRTETTTTPTTDTQLILIVGTRTVSIEPKSDAVAMYDGDLEVLVDAVVITSEGLFIADKPVKISAGEIVEKLAVIPQSIQLSSEDDQSVYNIQTKTQRKLFGFIPVRLAITFVVSGYNAEVLREHRPWYSFLTTN